MTAEERSREIRAVCDCLRYVQVDVDRARLPMVSLHIGLALAEAQTILDQVGDGPATAPRADQVTGTDG